MVAICADDGRTVLRGRTLPFGDSISRAVHRHGIAHIVIFLAKLLFFMGVIIWCVDVAAFSLRSIDDLGWRRFIRWRWRNILITAIVCGSPGNKNKCALWHHQNDTADESRARTRVCFNTEHLIALSPRAQHDEVTFVTGRRCSSICPTAALTKFIGAKDKLD